MPDTEHFIDDFITNDIKLDDGHNVILDDEIPSKDLSLGEKVVVRKNSHYYEQVKLDDGLYETELRRADLPSPLEGTVVNNITSHNYTMEIDGNTNLFSISDNAGNLRVSIGEVAAAEYGLKVNLSDGNEVFGLYGTQANIAGWDISTSTLSKNDIIINSAGNIIVGDDDDIIVLNDGSISDGNQDYRLWIGHTTASSADFFVKKDGELWAESGNIGGWTITDTVIKSDSGTGDRVQLDKSENRVSIFAETNTEKVAMGYLDELLKSNGTKVGTTTYSSTVMTDPGRTENAENTWQTNELVDLYIKPAGKSRVQIESNTGNTITVDAWSGGTPSTNDDFRIEFGSADYGFWVLPGDRLQIDGDIQYEGGDWLIQHDASLKIFNGAGLEILRLGTDTGEKGLFLYDGSGGGGYPAPADTMAKFHSTGFTIGDVSGGADNYISYGSGVLTIKGAISISTAEVGTALGYTPWTATEIAQITLSSSGMTFKNQSDDVLASYTAESIQLGVVEASNPNVLLNTNTLDFRVYNTTHATFGTTGLEIHPDGNENLGTIITSESLKVRTRDSESGDDGYKNLLVVSPTGMTYKPYSGFYFDGTFEVNNTYLSFNGHPNGEEKTAFKVHQVGWGTGNGDTINWAMFNFEGDGLFTTRWTKGSVNIGTITGDSVSGSTSFEIEGQADTNTITNMYMVPDFDSGWIDVPADGAGGNVAHNISGVDPNNGKFLDYRVYLSDEDSPNQSSSNRWVLWHGQATDDNDHFSIGFDASNFNYYHESSDGDTDVYWGTSAGEDLAACSFRILAWKLF